MMKINNVRKLLLICLTLALLIPLLAACSKKGGNETENRRTLRIGTMYGSASDDQWFRQQTTDMFEFAYKNIDIEIVPAIDYSQFIDYSGEGQVKQPDPVEKLKEIMNGDNPVDVVVLDLTTLGSLVSDNMLKQLDPLMKEDGMNVDDYVSTVIEGIKEQGDGFLYGMTSTFSSSALFYNKKLFADANVEPPHDGMSWDDVFNLARRMKSGEGKDAKFGFSFNQWGASEGFWDLQNFLAPLQLKMFDDNAETMTVNTPQWENAWKMFTDLHKDHIVPTQEDMQYMYEDQSGGNMRYNPYQGQFFLNGKVAMTVGDYYLINNIEQMNNNAEQYKIEKLQWDVVTMPHHAGKEGIGGNIYLNNLAAINAKATNPDDAWEFVKFMSGKEWAKFKSRSTSELSSLKEFVKVKDGMEPYNIEAFTKLKPAPTYRSSLKEQELYREKPNLEYIASYGDKYFQEVIRQESSVKEALAKWQEKGTDLLQKIKNQPTGEIEGLYEDLYGGGGGGGMPMPYMSEKELVMRASGEMVVTSEITSSEEASSEEASGESASSEDGAGEEAAE